MMITHACPIAFGAQEVVIRQFDTNPHGWEIRVDGELLASVYGVRTIEYGPCLPNLRIERLGDK
jgi:hypothetical protein